MHLDVEQITRWVDGALSPVAAASAEEHLAGCATCRRQVAEARVESQALQELLHHLDHAPSPVDARRVLRRARTHPRAWHRWAAGIAVAVGLGGAAYALPGSPLPAWIRAASDWVAHGGRARPATNREAAPVPGPAPGAPADSNVAGIAVAPGQHLVIAFTHARGQVQVSWNDGPQVVVLAPAGTARFDSRADRLVVDNADTTFQVQIPRQAPRIEIRAGERTLFLKEASIVTPPGVGEAGGPSLLSLAPP